MYVYLINNQEEEKKKFLKLINNWNFINKKKSLSIFFLSLSFIHSVINWEWEVVEEEEKKKASFNYFHLSWSLMIILLKKIISSSFFLLFNSFIFMCILFFFLFPHKLLNFCYNNIISIINHKKIYFWFFFLSFSLSLFVLCCRKSMTQT